MAHKHVTRHLSLFDFFFAVTSVDGVFVRMHRIESMPWSIEKVNFESCGLVSAWRMDIGEPTNSGGGKERG